MEPVGLSAYAPAKALDVPLPRVNEHCAREALYLSGNGGAALDHKGPTDLVATSRLSL